MNSSIKCLLLCISLFIQAISVNANSCLSEKSLNAAKQKAVLENKIIILEFTAKWCMPCRHMEKTVFENSAVKKFLEQHAVLYKVDIDEQKKLKEEYKIEVLPTTILMRASGKILSRKEESFNAESFIAWVEGHLELKTAKEQAAIQNKNDSMDALITLDLPLLDAEDFENQERDLNSEIPVPDSKSLNTNNSENSFYIQAGVFSNKENAENLAINLISHFKQEIKIAEETKDNKSTFKVRIGQFESNDEAEVFLEYLLKNNFHGVVKQDGGKL
ncbi:MAG: thioredoxin family protein [Saprospiraceae bacterium]|nr:thioredoxin family protein [Saprospiraceae bacterium]MBK9221030.1 thioredoxin family protein [Saprospiraceae bacterium]MBK9722118.1 thioredoxin family protein [Saprospiraceae bacterium]MBK9729165.1 thioredoxin family protein [Saprospiraceae bacterium]